MPFYLAWIYSNFSRWNFKFFSISELSYGTNQNFMPFIQAQFFVAQSPQKLHSEKLLNFVYFRRHGCALLVKIATRYPQALVPVFDYLRQTIIDDLFNKQKALFKMEFVTLVEGLVLVSNEFQNFDVQSRFIENLCKPVCDRLKALEVHFHSPGL